MNICYQTHRGLVNVLMFALFFCSTQLHAQQLEATGGNVLPYTPENLITNTFLGSGVQVTDIQYSGATKAVGHFSGGKNSIGLERGIILSTGVASKVSGKGSDGAQDNNDLNQEFQSDPDLQQVANGADLRNVAKYTIKFIPSADTLRFRYVFASEEYPEFVCSDFNDVFGFFITGPGISGSYVNGGENIAMVPGTNFPVSINHVNGGESGVWGVPGNCAEPIGSLNYSNFFNQNYNSNFQPVYDGFTNVFTAQAVVIPCQEYTIKLAIADVEDEGYDSGVFLEAKSFGTQQVKLEADTYSPDGAVTEACTDGYIKFKLNYPASSDYSIDYTVFGTATNGVDFENLPGTLIIPAGSDTATLRIRAFEDDILEPTEVIYIDVEKDMCSRDTVAIYIKDNALVPPILDSFEICEGNSVTLDGSIPITNVPGAQFESNRLVAVSPYNTTVESEIQVSNVFPPNLKKGMIKSVCINVDHSNPEDLEIYLAAPDGSFILLTSDNGTGGENYSNTCFSPDASTSVKNGTAPFSGSFLPEGKWEDLYENNSLTNGTWKLMLRDDEIGSTGVLTGWSIQFESTYSVDFSWTGGGGIDCNECPTTDILPIQSETYQLEITDSYGCSVNASSEILVKVPANVPPITCDTATFNSVTFRWQPVADIFHFEIRVSGGNWEQIDPTETQLTVAGLTPGEVVDFELRAIGDCPGTTETASCQSLNCIPPVVTVTEISPVSCAGNADASVQLTASGIAALYQFELNGTINQTGLFENLSHGNYSVIVSDELGCSTVFDFEIEEPLPLDVTIDILEKISCFGFQNGIIEAQASGGTLPYTFEWQNVTGTTVRSGLSAGVYTVIVSDAAGCEVISSIELTEPSQLIADITAFNISCNGARDGSISISPQGGTSPYSFEWQNGATSASVDNLEQGQYGATITDDNGCIFEVETSVLENEAITLQIGGKNPECAGGENGLAIVTATGGTNNFKYRWNTGDDQFQIENLTAGNYQVTVTDTDNCIAEEEITLIDPPSLHAEFQKEDVSCADAKDGQVSISVSGGTPSYEVIWHDGIRAFERSDLSAGTYDLQISDSLNCTMAEILEINEPEPIDLNITVQNPRCFGEATGQIELNAVGGSNNFQYDFGTGLSDESTLGSLSAGNYSIVVSDENSCTASANVTLTQPNEIIANEEVKNISCFGKRDGSVRVNLEGGSGTFAHAWSNQSGNLGSADFIDFLPEGEYELYANDSNGCLFRKTFNITAPEALIAAHEAFPITCSNRNDGEILLEIEGGTFPYKVFLNGFPKGDTEQITELPKGEYFISIQDANNCVFESETIIVEEEYPFEVRLGEDTIVKYGTLLPIEPKIISRYNVEKFEWKTHRPEILSCYDCPQTVLEAKHQSTVSLKITDEKGCTTEDDLRVFVQKNFQVLVPTGFTPNGDGANDRLLVHGTDGVLIENFRIYDRWGEMVFETGDFYVNDPTVGWDGIFRSKNMNSGVFVWYAETLSEDGSRETYQGETTLIR